MTASLLSKQWHINDHMIVLSHWTPVDLRLPCISLIQFHVKSVAPDKTNANHSYSSATSVWIVVNPNSYLKANSRNPGASKTTNRQLPPINHQDHSKASPSRVFWPGHKQLSPIITMLLRGLLLIWPRQLVRTRVITIITMPSITIALSQPLEAFKCGWSTQADISDHLSSNKIKFKTITRTASLKKWS